MGAGICEGSVSDIKELQKCCMEAESWPMGMAFAEDLCPQLVAASTLIELKKAYEKGDALALLEAVKVSWEKAFSVPLWAHEQLKKYFDLFLSNQGFSLDVLLKLRCPGRDNNPFRRRELLDRNQEILYQIEMHNKFFGFSLPVTYWILSEVGVEIFVGGKKKRERISSSQINEIKKASSVNHFDGFFDDENKHDRLFEFYSCHGDINFQRLFKSIEQQSPELERSFKRTIRNMTKDLEKHMNEDPEKTGG